MPKYKVTIKGGGADRVRTFPTRVKAEKYAKEIRYARRLLRYTAKQRPIRVTKVREK